MISHLRLTRILRAARGQPGSLSFAAGLSLALHGAALAAALWMGTGTPPAPLTLQTIPLVVIEAPASAGGKTEAVASPPAASTPQVAHAESEPPEPAEPPAEAAPPTPPAPKSLAAPAPAATASPALEHTASPPHVAPPPRKPEPPEPKPARTEPSAPPKGARKAPESAATPPPQTAARMPIPAPGGDAEKTIPPRHGLAGLSNPPPDYPWLARRNGEEGRVVVRVAVDETGRVRQVEVARSSGHTRLDRAALKALKRWRFAPAERGGRPTAGTVEVPVTFRLTHN